MADSSNKDLNALVKAQETRGSVNDLVNEYITLTLQGSGIEKPTGDDLWHAQEGIGKLFRSELESGDSDTVMRALNGLAVLRRQHRKNEKRGPPDNAKHGADGALSAASGANADGGHEVSPDKPTRADHGRSMYDQDPQREIQDNGKEPKHPQVPDEHDKPAKKHK